MAEQSYAIVIVPLPEEDGGGFYAFVPDLYGCVSDGESIEEAAANIQSAIGEWCDEMVRLGREIPEPGTAEQEAMAERKSLADLLAKQDDLLKEQTEHVRTLKAEIEALKAGMGRQYMHRQRSALGTWGPSAEKARMVVGVH